MRMALVEHISLVHHDWWVSSELNNSHFAHEAISFWRQIK